MNNFGNFDRIRHSILTFYSRVGTTVYRLNYIVNLGRVLGRAYRGLTGGFLLLRNFSVTISVSPHVCLILV